ncbi:hypothetical protein ACIRBZ_47325 [Streptomyces sp. NPDC094038]|uniref:hypothetical protein n=1 Tax=Streptomyces sp. NPDC094038 TaxID=3366055 RepID=UPI0037FBF913
MKEWDIRDNEETRLSSDETLHLGGIVLAEVFTPSTVTNLYRALEKMPGRDEQKKQERISRIKTRRRGSGIGGWESLGYVRREGQSILGDGFTDPDLPEGVDAVWMRLHYPIPSVAVLVATFTLSETWADLSEILRADYRTQARDRKLHVYGRFSRVRAKMPWARPKLYRTGHSIYGVEQQKREACEELIAKFERECWGWLTKHFPGRFATEDTRNRPAIRILLTRNSVPLVERSRPLALVGLDHAWDAWSSSEAPGWMLNFRNWPLDERRRFGILAAARRSDVARGDQHGEPETSAWYLIQKFHDYHSGLMVRWTLMCLLSIYADRLGGLRDRAAARRRFDGSVRKARDLDIFLLGDGLDASTVASEMRKFTDSLKRFRYGVVEYEQVDDRPSGEAVVGESSRGSRYLRVLPKFLTRKVVNSRESTVSSSQTSRVRAELSPALHEMLNEQSAQLVNDMSAVTDNIRASAELRQAIANTRLQRVVVLLAVIATAASVVGVLISTVWS